MREQKDSPIKMGTETQTLKSNCIHEIQNEVEPFWLSIQSLRYKLSIKTIQNNRVLLYKDEFDRISKQKNPAFTEVEIARMKAKLWLYRLIILGFTVAEGFLYYLVAPLFVPGGTEYMKICVSIFLAIVVMLALDWGFENHFLFREANLKFTRKEISESEFKKFKDKRTIAYVLISLAIGTILAAGLARIFYMEYIPSNGLPLERIHTARKASKLASFVTLFVTCITGVLMAVIKLEQTANCIKYKVYQAWHKAHVKRNEYSQLLIKNARKIKLIVEEKIQKYWQLIIELRRTFSMHTEYDNKHEELNAHFLNLISQPGFVLNDDVYRKFARIESAHEILFEYGIFNNQSVREKIAGMNDVLKVTTDHIGEHQDKSAELTSDAAPFEKEEIKGSSVRSNHVAMPLNTLLVLVLAFLMGSCNTDTINKPLNVIVLPDFSYSRDSTTTKWYESVIEDNIIAHLGKRDALQILPIDKDSKTFSKEIYRVDFSRNNYSNEFAGLNAKEMEQNAHIDSLKAATRRFARSFELAIKERKASNTGSDITGALSVGKKYLRDDCNNLIVLLSDMKQYSDADKMNFEKYLNDVSEIQHYLSLTEKSDLQGASIIVLTGNNKVSSGKFNVIAAFWSKYFHICHAELIDYSSGAVSVLENYIVLNSSDANE